MKRQLNSKNCLCPLFQNTEYNFENKKEISLWNFEDLSKIKKTIKPQTSAKSEIFLFKLILKGNEYKLPERKEKNSLWLQYRWTVSL